ncbi:hypothetical protein M878_15000 [Streptomyces roseochromogenus subsp. oscitans DS 12.976]|uniref:Protein kinase domain-containing protein n=1 Tax=Streptomyces roseochromogenus subsp. oscitans DS 12.976 TaxID=1352936 RepID=V6KJ96_STRRC|nr:hypothetical protein M878_15000 [Streptomyces roseochromogenus subsp. oscitans DS 12.976]
MLDADPEAAVPWLATRYIPGPDPHSALRGRQGLRATARASAHSLANRLALASQAVHGAGLIRRGLRPSNVLVAADGPRVIDFGIARAMDRLTGNSLHTRTGMLIGSPGFMPPEQVRGFELTPASDVFCLGVALVHAATGRLLFGSAETGLNAHLFRVAEDEADLTGVPESRLDLVRACSHKAPAERLTPRQAAAERTTTEPAGHRRLAGGVSDGGSVTELPVMSVIGFGLGIAFMPVFSLDTDTDAPGTPAGPRQPSSRPSTWAKRSARRCSRPWSTPATSGT